MYRWLRNTHLLLGLFCCLFVMMYGVSSVQMSHNGWFTQKPVITESKVAISAGSAASPRAAARELMERQGMHGDLAQVKETPAGFQFRIARPGTFYEVDYSRAAGEAKVRTTVASFMGLMNRLHHVAGLRYEDTVTEAWGILVGVVSGSLILLALTGIYLWFKIHSERVIGLILLAVSLGFSLTLMILIRTA